MHWGERSVAAEWGDVATWLSGIATTVAVGFAGLQLRTFRKQQEEERRIETAGVAVEWKLADIPAPPTGGTAESEYVFTLTNPGRLPVTHVDVHIRLPLSVRLVNSDGSLDEPCTEFRLDTPVVAGGGTRQWWRTLRFAVADRGGLRDMTAVVHFQDLEGNAHETRWGRTTAAVRPPDRARQATDS